MIEAGIQRENWSRDVSRLLPDPFPRIYAQRVEQALVLDGVCGFRVDSYEQFAGAVIELWKNLQLRETMGGAAREHVTGNFGMDQIEQVYGSLLEH